MKTLRDCALAVERMLGDRVFGRLVAARADSAPVVAGNLVGSAAALFTAAWARRSSHPVVLLTATVGEAQGLAEDLELFPTGRRVHYLPTGDESGFLAGAGHSAFGRKLDIARALGRGDRDLVVVSSVTAWLEALPAPEDIRAAMLELRVGEEQDRELLVDKLAGSGFDRVSHVESPGEFALRGGIVDIFDHMAASPWRIELFGDEVESIRSFAPDTQRSLDTFEVATISLSRPRQAGEGSGCRLPEILPASVDLLLRDAAEILQHLETRREQRALAGRPDPVDHAAELAERSPIRLERLPVAPDGLDFDIGAFESGGADMAAAIEALDRYSREGQELLVAFSTDPERQRFWSAVEEESSELLFRSLGARDLRGLVGSFFRGFHWRAQRLTLVNHRELFNVAFQRRRIRAEDAPLGKPIDDFVDLSPGDYVVHVAQGIARFLGVETIEKGGETQEFMTLEFADGLLLYVPVAKADLVQKYIGGKGDEPKLSKIGGKSWSKKKEEVYRAVADLAAEMLETQAVRAREEGHAYPEDGPWQHQFEAAFPYEETPDQLTAVDAIKIDMESRRPMDRLICGDVGYGKTEVAMRAAFKAVMAGKQVAVLVPTTVLAEQHLRSFRERMMDFPVTIEGMSRFRSKGEQETTLVGLVEGSVDIVIGTHRLLSKDVAFKDLGLIVIDEEQRFGVAHKEKLRRFKRTVDVLTLTATPIPRTLHLSLLGIRDISSLTQAPRGRQPVETRIVRFDEGLVRAAVLGELERGGQCFFVHNRVQTIERVRKELARIVPEARVLVLHGQMHEREVERNLMAFVRQEADVLLATTIIESGLDIQSANTIFIDRPDMYGLADLHQLRGRVGRYRVKAHAYLLLRPDVVLGDDAERRLRAIEEFDDLGSGFRIAMRDLEIRGAGNLLGHQQSGHIAAVGYDMYCRLLEAAVKEMSKQRAVLPDEVDINLDFEAYLPSDYIEDPKLKLEMYRKLGRCSADAEFALVRDELVDRFGRPPAIVDDFLFVCRIRALAEELELKRLATVAGRGLLLRPGRMKSVRRRLMATETEHRVIGGVDVLLPDPAALASPRAAWEKLVAALRPERGPQDPALERAPGPGRVGGDGSEGDSLR
ncbi:MAG: transcription-repair coupling factor [Planctomycetes bacterium]|nr:transcription-repair coupling factor [Planctomycetota bacterium]